MRETEMSEGQKGLESVVGKEIEILEHRAEPTNDLEAQFLLAEDLYKRDVDADPDMKDREVRNHIMIHWGQSGYSAMFRKIFSEHPILRQNFKAITLEIVDRYVKTPHLFEREIGSRVA